MNRKSCQLKRTRRSTPYDCTQRVLTLSVLIGSMWGTQIAYGAVGDLDSTFGIGGKVVTSLSAVGEYERIYDVAVQSDGKIVVAGSTALATTGDDFVVTRYNANGTLDTSFGTGGVQVTDFDGNNDYASAIALQSDGKIVVAGTAYTNDGSDDFAVARYNADGTLDTSFGTGGIQTTDITQSEGASSIAVQSDGKIVIAGGTYMGDNGEYDFAVVRYNADGTLDTTFGSDGTLTTGIGNSSDYVYDLDLQSDGKIVVAGSTYTDVNSNDFAVARYNADGTLDTSFGTGGIVTTDFNADGDTPRAITVQSDGKIVVAGGTYVDDTYEDFALARYNADGTLDTTFSDDGIQTTDFNADEDSARAITVQSDGKIVAAGYSYISDVTGYDAVVARYNADGTLDTSFSTDGKQTTDFNSDDDGANAVAIQSDGKIVIAGHTNSGDATEYDFALARYSITSNVAPVANAGPDQNVPQLSVATAVTLDGSASYDADGNSLTYTWRENGQVIASSASPTVNLAAGTHILELTVSDGILSSSDSVVVTVAIPASTMKSSVSGDGAFKTHDGNVKASFDARYNKNGISGEILIEDRGRKITIKSRKVNTLFVQGNTAYIYGTCSINGEGKYAFVLVAVDGVSDGFALEVSNGYARQGILTSGKVKVVAPYAR